MLARQEGTRKFLPSRGLHGQVGLSKVSSSESRSTCWQEVCVPYPSLDPKR